MTKKEKKFVKAVWAYYRTYGRHDLPWRRTRNPYRILVSEVMLQQTQVERVIPKYREFLRKFPSLASLARAPLSDVLRLWQGLGYNRRAKMLHDCAKTVMNKFRGLTPKAYRELVKLPGVGPYTAGSIMAFAWNEGVPIIETNIRSAYIHHFFKGKTGVSDNDILHIVERTLDKKRPREWYYALMDYGVHIKKTAGNENRRSKHYVRQSVFKGSDRQLRGMLLSLLTKKGMTRTSFHKGLPFESDRINVQLIQLMKGDDSKGGKDLPTTWSERSY